MSRPIYGIPVATPFNPQKVAPPISDEQIAKAVDNYLLENPVEGQPGPAGPQGEPGPQGPKGDTGASGKDGQDGYTPVKGVDYFDGQPGKDGSDGKDGADGYTPVKGKDYFDGKDGQDGSPGKDGSNGVSATHSWNGTVLTVTSASGTSSADLKGATGKTAYAYAQDGGYTGTEEEFAAKLAQVPLVDVYTNITPTQVYEAVTASRDVVVMYPDKTFGLFGFTAFDVQVSLNLVYSSAILTYNGMYAVVELIGDLNANTWQFVIQQVATINDIPTPLVGTTDKLTPDDVCTALLAGRPVSITHTNFMYGKMTFGYTSHASLIGNQVVSSIIFESGGMVFAAQLFGDLQTNTWSFQATMLATINDIPVIPTALKNPSALTINGTTYDGSSAVDMTEKVNALIDAKLSAITNAEEVAF
jgi:hypothetical protein